MSTGSKRGSEWRRWDLHIHTKGTNKNDQYRSLKDFDAFCVSMFQKALDNKIAAIGITDYFSIDNYIKVTEFVKNIGTRTEFNSQQKELIKDILLLPNVELRMLPVTEPGRLVNIHCIFNPKIASSLDNDFFGSVEFHSGDRSHKMNRDGLIGLGKSMDPALDDAAAYKKGVDNFVVSQSQLQKLLKETHFAENTLIIVSNSSTDGASGFQKHYDFFEDEDPGSLEAVRKSIYYISHAIFSSNESDRQYFLGQKSDNESIVKTKCGSLKPCVHGSDAHSEDKLFAPDNDRFCWIKSDVTFEGLKQIIYEPADRVFIGIEPPVLNRVSSNKTKYLTALSVNQKPGYDKAQGSWFQNVHIDLNKELIAIIGNKGSGKSALSDIVGVLGNTHNAGPKHENLSFLNARKFRKRGYAENFEAEMIWEDGSGKGELVPLNQDVDPDRIERVRYLPQSYFENLTNDLEGEGFDQTLKSVIFLHLPEEQRLEARTFDELESIKSKSIEADLVRLREEAHKISLRIIDLEDKRHPSSLKQIESSIAEKSKELQEHEKNKPIEIPDPAKKVDPKLQQVKSRQYAQLEKLNIEKESLDGQISARRSELVKLTKDDEELQQLNKSLARLEDDFESYKLENREIFEKFSLDVNEIVKFSFDKTIITSSILKNNTNIELVSGALRTKESIDNDPNLRGKTEAIKKAYEASLIIQQTEKLEKISDISKLLSQPEKLYQDYKEKLSKWEKRKLSIEGSDTHINTLKFFIKEKDYIINQLTVDLAKARQERLDKSLEIFKKKKEIIDLYRSFKQSIDSKISKDEEFSKKFKMEIDVNFRLDADFATRFLQFINKSRRGTFYGAGNKEVSDLFIELDLLSEVDLSSLLETIISLLELDQREKDDQDKNRQISDQIERVHDFYDFLFSLEYLKPIYELKLDDKVLEELSPGEKGTLLLVFYLMIDKEDTPLVIDQPEDNLDNKSVFEVLTHFIKNAKKRRQIIIVTHNPNLAIGADAEQVIYVALNKKDSQNAFSFEVGAIENPTINKRLVEILEGTMPAFDKRKLRYKD